MKTTLAILYFRSYRDKREQILTITQNKDLRQSFVGKLPPNLHQVWIKTHVITTLLGILKLRRRTRLVLLRRNVAVAATDQLIIQYSEMILIINEINRRDKRKRLGILEALQTHHVIDYD